MKPYKHPFPPEKTNKQKNLFHDGLELIHHI